MLTNVPTGINRMARNIVINHPNSFECQMYRKSVDRANESVVSGMPTIGGLGVISAEDEENISYDLLGNGYALQAEPFSPSSIMERQDANNGFANEFRFLIEPEQPTGAVGSFMIKKGDVMLIVISDDVRLAYEVVDTETVMNISPFAMRYVTNRRGDLDLPG